PSPRFNLPGVGRPGRYAGWRRRQLAIRSAGGHPGYRGQFLADRGSMSAPARPGRRRCQCEKGMVMAASDFEVRDERFARLPSMNATVRKLFGDCDWAEGPAYFPAGRYLVWSDVPN